MSPSFMSVNTFISWIFSWMAAMDIDFCQEIDPWCKHQPKMLACDGTHVAVGIRQINIPKKIEDPELDINKKILIRHYNRGFFAL